MLQNLVHDRKQACLPTRPARRRQPHITARATGPSSETTCNDGRGTLALASVPVAARLERVPGGSRAVVVV